MDVHFFRNEEIEMNRFLPALILAGLLAGPGWAAVEPGAEKPSGQVTEPQADVDAAGRNGVEAEGEGSSGADRHQRLKDRIKTSVLAAVAEAVEDNPEISEEDKRKIAAALENAAGGGDLSALEDLDDIDIDLDLDGLDDGMDVVAILAVTLIFGTPIMLVAAFLFAGYRKRRLAREMAGDFLASGQPVPPEVWQGLAGDATSRSNLHKGMIMLGVGAGVFLAFWLMGADEAAYLALIPLFIGLAQLLVWKLENRDADSGK
ncbi:MAG: DUF6249 domain-containing protein [Gammaproteobacteria bacterium]